MLIGSDETGRRAGGGGGIFDFTMLLELTAGSRGNPVRVACPKCGPDRRSAANRGRRVLAVWIKSDFASYACARCGIHGWARAGDWSARGRLIARAPYEHAGEGHEEAESKRRFALALWREAAPIGATPAANYLALRALEVPPDASECLRFHPSAPFGGVRHPCLLALMRDIVSDAPRGIQRTALTADGRKIAGMTLGAKAGAAIKLWPDSNVCSGLVIGEGMETVLAAALRIAYRGTLLRPAWAVGDARNLETFPVLPGIGSLTILVDCDTSGTGQAAAQACARRWRAAGREVIRLVPRQVDKDFADIVSAA
jgi:hypothetical protein